jgi:glycolate dehydrogenase FAD-binding subunit
VSGVTRPAADWELASFLADASTRGRAVEIVGGGSKRFVGRPTAAAEIVSTHVLRGIRSYDPGDLVMSAQAGTTLAEIENELARRGQMLAFEPVDLGPVMGEEAGRTTIGGVFATNLSGSRRVSAGAARDHLVGLHGVSGGGEVFQSGARVLKSVAGLDLCRAVCGSWGTLAVLFETAFRTMPRPERTATLVLLDQTDEIAIETLCVSLGVPVEVSGAVHINAGLSQRLRHDGLRDTGASVTAIRLENFAAFLPDRIERLRRALRHFGEIHVLDDTDSQALWGELRQLSVVTGDRPLWRILTLPKHASAVITGIRRHMPVEAYYDWSGGLIWLEVPESADAGATDVRRVLASFGGHATLIRASDSARGQVEVFHPVDPGIERMTRALKSVFDPAGILNPGRMYAAH